MLRLASRALCRSSPSCSTRHQQHKPYTDDQKTSTSDNNTSRTSQLKKYWLSRYVAYIKNYESVLERNFPRTVQMYRVFSVGTRNFYSDLKRYLRLRKKQRELGADALTRDELQLTFSFPKDLIKISPVLLLSAIPFTNYVIFPLAFYFPHKILTSHYWSIQDKLNFTIKEHKRRLVYNKPLLRCMQREIRAVRDAGSKTLLKDVLACLGSGTHPSVDAVVSCEPMFSGPPFSLRHIKRKHVKELLRIHGMSAWGWRSRSRLMDRGVLIKRMDTAIVREGGVAKLPYDAMRWALSFRGLNPVNMSTESMQAWLDQWLLVSSRVKNDSISLLLHCPILLAYNHETNWTLLYSHKKKHK